MLALPPAVLRVAMVPGEDSNRFPKLLGSREFSFMSFEKAPKKAPKVRMCPKDSFAQSTSKAASASPIVRIGFSRFPHASSRTNIAR